METLEPDDWKLKMKGNSPPFWGTFAGIAIRWIIFVPLFLGLWILGLNVCSLASTVSSVFLCIPIFGAVAVIGILVIGLPSLIAGLPKLVATILLPVFFIGSIFIIYDMAKKGASGWELAAVAVFSLMVVVGGFAMINIDKKP
jgi:hypothetical protein